MDNIALDGCGLLAVALLTLSALKMFMYQLDTPNWDTAQRVLCSAMVVEFVLGLLLEIT